MNTPETDALLNRSPKQIGFVAWVNELSDFARKLERERDEARALERKMQDRVFGLLADRNQLRKVCDELANAARKAIIHDAYTFKLNAQEAATALTNYNTLPHVLERNEK